MSHLKSFRSRLSRAWRHALLRRSQRYHLQWTRFKRLIKKYLPPCLVVHPHQGERFNVKTFGWSRMRSCCTYGSVLGGSSGNWSPYRDHFSVTSSPIATKARPHWPQLQLAGVGQFSLPGCKVSLLARKLYLCVGALVDFANYRVRLVE